MILYHGTDYKAWRNIQKTINVSINFTNERELDFGYGFYLSSRKWYAVYSARSKALAEMFQEDSNADEDYPVVISCDVDVDSILSNVETKSLIHKYKTRQFLNDVFTARFYRAGIDTLNVDFVCAPISDGWLSQLMRWYKKKPTKLRRIVCKLGYLLPVPATQYIIKKQELCKYVKIISCEPIKVKGGKRR